MGDANQHVGAAIQSMRAAGPSAGTKASSAHARDFRAEIET